MSDTLIYNTTPNNDMYYYKLNNEAALRDVYLYTKRRKYITAATNMFIDMAKELYNNSK